jgi:predicted short-subunit dehydrogenase-like oxidoreductase (DUF2520 family)
MMGLPEKIETITLIGAGNVAWHLGKGLALKGYNIKEVWSKTLESASDLAGRIGAKSCTDMELLDPDVDLYIISVSDAAITGLSRLFNGRNSMVVHTSGSVPMSEISGTSSMYGVLYPLQTFSKYIPINLAEVPFCIEASSDEALLLIRQVAQSLSANVHFVNSEERLLLHVSAVFASNYSNFMYMLAGDILASKGLSFDLLKPLVAETAHKVLTSEPYRVQTGPAKRGDTNVIDKHLKLLASMPEYAEIYSLLAERLRQRFHP